MDDSWKVDLEIALLEDADLPRIRSICSNRPLPSNSRPQVWRACLFPKLAPESKVHFDDKFSLPNQYQLHSDCERAAVELVSVLHAETPSETPPGSVWSTSDLEDDDDDDVILPTSPETHSYHATTASVEKLTNELESCLTNFARVHSLPYRQQDGWVSIIRILYSVLKPTDRCDLYDCFVALYQRFIPFRTEIHSQCSAAFRLLLQYHEPKLCCLLDSLKLDPDAYATTWIFSLFSLANLTDLVLFSLWDVYFLQSDPLLGFFITLVLLVNAKSNFFPEPSTDQSSGTSSQSTVPLNPQKLTQDEVLSMLLDLPKPMQPDDVVPLIELAQFFARRTPTLFHTRASSLLFTGDSVNPTECLFTESLCLSVSVDEIMKVHQIVQKGDEIYSSEADKGDHLKSDLRYLLVDCRPAEQYNAGHLHTAFFLDSELMLTDSALFQNAVTALLQAQHRAINVGSHVAGEHIALLGTGCSNENRVIDMVASTFLRSYTPYVSLVEGGYMGLHRYLQPYGVDQYLSNHDSNRCLCCSDQYLGSNAKLQRVLDSTKPVVSRHTTTVSDAAKLSVPSNEQPTKALRALLSKFSGRLSVLYNASTKTASKQITSFTQPPDTKLTSKDASNQKDSISLSAHSVTPREKSLSYRNTTSVFSIDDDVDEDDFDLNSPVSNVDEVPKVLDNPTQPTSKRSNWLKSLYTKSAQDNSLLPAGDIPDRPGGLDSSEPGDLIDISHWSSRPEVRGVFECHFVDPSGRIADDGYLVLVERHLLVLGTPDRRLSGRLLASLGSAINSVLPVRSSLLPTPMGLSSSTVKRAVVLRSIHLSLITRITSNKRIPECITFHYSASDPAELLLLNGQTMGVRDRLYIPQAGEAVRMIKLAVFNTTYTHAA